MLEIYGKVIKTIVIIGMSSILLCFMGLCIASVIRFCFKTISNWFENGDE
jgi:hypothetical protein